MWFNLKILKEVIRLFCGIEAKESRLLFPKILEEWSLNTSYFYHKYQIKEDFPKKAGYFLLDQEKFVIAKSILTQNSKKFFKEFLSKNGKHFLDFNISWIFLRTGNDFFIKKVFLKRKYNLLLLKKSYHLNRDSESLSQFILLSVYFFFSDMLLLGFDIYTFIIECRYIDLYRLNLNLKYIFLQNCTISCRKMIWNLSGLIFNSKHVFFNKNENESRWIENSEVLKPENLDFFFSLPIEPIFKVWERHVQKEGEVIDDLLEYVYKKYVFIKTRKNYINYKLNYLKKKQYIIKVCLEKKNFLNSPKKVLTSKYDLHKLVPFLSNRLKLLNLINASRNKREYLKKKEKSIKYGDDSLIDADILYAYDFFFVIYASVLKKKYKVKNVYLKELKEKIKFIRKSVKMIFKLIFIIYQKLHFVLEVDFPNFVNKYLFSFLFCYKARFPGSIENNLESYEALNKENKSAVDYLSSFCYVFYLHFDEEVINYKTKCFDYLYHSLFLTYKETWIQLNSVLFKRLFRKERLFLKKLKNLQFFFINEANIKRLHDIYILFSFKFWTLDEIKLLIKHKLWFLNLILYKKFKVKNLLNLKVRKYLKKHKKNLKFKNNLLISSLIFIGQKIKKLGFINWKSMITLFFNIDHKHFQSVFKDFNSFLLSGLITDKERNIFVIERPNSYHSYLQEDLVENKNRRFRKIMYCVFFIKILSKLKNLSSNLKFLKESKFYFIIYLFKKYINKNIGLKIERQQQKNILTKNINLTNEDLKFISYISYNFLEVKKKTFLINSLEFFLKLNENLYERFMDNFKNFFIADIILTSNENFIGWDNVEDTLYTHSYIDFLEKNDLKNKYLLWPFNLVQYEFLFLRIQFDSLFWQINWEKKNIFILWFNLANSKKKLYGDINMLDSFLSFDEVYLDGEGVTDTKVTLNYYRDELKMLMVFFLKYYGDLKWELNLLSKNTEIELKLLNRKLIFINYNLWFYNKFIYNYFFKSINLKKKLKLKLKCEVFVQNSKFKNYFFLLSPVNFFFKFVKKFFFLRDPICEYCSSLVIDYYSFCKVKYYQKILGLNSIVSSIKKFTFIFCSKCSRFKITLGGLCLRSFLKLNDVVKYFYNEGKKNVIAYCDSRLYYCSAIEGQTNIFVTKLIPINIDYDGYFINFVFVYFGNIEVLSNTFFFLSERINFWLFIIGVQLGISNKLLWMSQPSIYTMVKNIQESKKRAELFLTLKNKEKEISPKEKTRIKKESLSKFFRDIASKSHTVDNEGVNTSFSQKPTTQFMVQQTMFNMSPKNESHIRLLESKVKSDEIEIEDEKKILRIKKREVNEVWDDAILEDYLRSEGNVLKNLNEDLNEVLKPVNVFKLRKKYALTNEYLRQSSLKERIKKEIVEYVNLTLDLKNKERRLKKALLSIALDFLIRQEKLKAKVKERKELDAKYYENKKLERKERRKKNKELKLKLGVSGEKKKVKTKIKTKWEKMKEWKEELKLVSVPKYFNRERDLRKKIENAFLEENVEKDELVLLKLREKIWIYLHEGLFVWYKKNEKELANLKIIEIDGLKEKILNNLDKILTPLYKYKYKNIDEHGNDISELKIYLKEVLACKCEKELKNEKELKEQILEYLDVGLARWCEKKWKNEKELKELKEQILEYLDVGLARWYENNEMKLIEINKVREIELNEKDEYKLEQLIIENEIILKAIKNKDV